jgi:NSS family neurotransmitter:Na+ symporter
MSNNNDKKLVWSSKLTFILAASGSAVGLGNIWRFPYLVGKHGGGTFILLYLLFAFLIAGSILLAEFVLGRYFGNPILPGMKEKLGKHKFINACLNFTLFIPSIILTIYFVITGWILYYIGNTITQSISYNNLPASYYGEIFGGFLNSPITLIICTIIFIAITLFINYKGLISGIERANLYLLPLLFVLLIGLIIRILSLDGIKEGFMQVFQINLSSINAEMLIDALGQAFFSFSLGGGAVFFYSSFSKKDIDLKSATISTVFIDTAVGIFSALLIIPATYAFGFTLNAGPGLTFITLPAIVSQIPFGTIFILIFFLTMGFAALTSTISMVEASVPVVQKLFNSQRNKALFILAIFYIVTTSIQALSFNHLGWLKVFDKNIFDLVDFTTNILLILGVLITSVTVGWILKKDIIVNEVTSNGRFNFKLFNVWLFVIKYITPIVIVIILLSSLGL